MRLCAFCSKARPSFNASGSFSCSHWNNNTWHQHLVDLMAGLTGEDDSHQHPVPLVGLQRLGTHFVMRHLHSQSYAIPCHFVIFDAGEREVSGSPTSDQNIRATVLHLWAGCLHLSGGILSQSSSSDAQEICTSHLPRRSLLKDGQRGRSPRGQICRGTRSLPIFSRARRSRGDFFGLVGTFATKMSLQHIHPSTISSPSNISTNIN